MPLTAEERADAWRKATFWVGGVTVFLTLAVIIIGIWAVIDARQNKQDLVSAFKENNRLGLEAAATRTQLEKERAEKERLAKTSIEKLMYDYNAHLADLQKAVDTYVTTKALPLNAEGATAKKAQAERELYITVTAFTTFIIRWRGVASALDKLLDGNVDRLDQASQRRNPEDVRDAIQVLIKTYPDLKQVLEVQLSTVASG